MFHRPFFLPSWAVERELNHTILTIQYVRRIYTPINGTLVLFVREEKLAEENHAR